MPKLLTRKRKRYIKQWNKDHPNYKKQYYKEHLEQEKKRAKQWYKGHHEEIREHKRKYRQEHKEEEKERNKQWKKEHPDHCKQYSKQWRQEHSEHIKQYDKKWQEEHPEYMKQWWQSLSGKEARKRGNAKRREFDFNPLNNYFEGSVAHHINYKDVIYIPEEMHKGTYHCLETRQGMFDINMLAIRFLISKGGSNGNKEKRRIGERVS